jgi:hypothetical protein
MKPEQKKASKEKKPFAFLRRARQKTGAGGGGSRS